MSKVNEALTNLEKARVTALEAAISDRAYRLCAALDAEGSVQRGIDRAKKLADRLAARSETPAPKPEPKSKRK